MTKRTGFFLLGTVAAVAALILVLGLAGAPEDTPAPQYTAEEVEAHYLKQLEAARQAKAAREAQALAEAGAQRQAELRRAAEAEAARAAEQQREAEAALQAELARQAEEQRAEEAAGETAFAEEAAGSGESDGVIAEETPVAIEVEPAPAEEVASETPAEDAVVASESPVSTEAATPVSPNAPEVPSSGVLDQLADDETPGIGKLSTVTLPPATSGSGVTPNTDVTGAIIGTDTSVAIETPVTTRDAPVTAPVAEEPVAPTATEAPAAPAGETAKVVALPSAPTPTETPPTPVEDAPVVAEAPAPTQTAPASKAPTRKSTSVNPALKKPATELKSVPKLSARGVTVTGTAARPQFPWPPPQASTVVRLPLERFDDAMVRGVQGEIADLLEGALDQGGYFDRSYWVAPGGFALATRLERITDQGEPVDANDRWPTSALKERFDLSKYLRALFYTDPGFFRVIVFVLSTGFERTSDQEPTPKEAFRWLRRGMVTLPKEIAEKDIEATHNLTALIYEFEKVEGAEAIVLAPGRITGRDHLRSAGLLGALAPN